MSDEMWVASVALGLALANTIALLLLMRALVDMASRQTKRTKWKDL